ncbi:MAG: single-stranded-DNA-specific exonuclease RecJ [Candidatus Gracilibacteria bacterium]|nr:single-stranded-DNA-specific exonuclease RecJ [Candidatus Gracilibacteria bacterium]
MNETLSLKGNIIKIEDKAYNENIEKILSGRFDKDDSLNKTIEDLYDPYLLKGMNEGVERIKKAKELGQKVMIFGDYDVDGVTATSILMHAFKKIGINASYRLPHRIHDGYGLKNYFIDEMEALGVDLVITVDCGTKDIEAINHAKQKNIDVIVTDHHSVPDIIPEGAIAIINPKREDCSYPFKQLSGAGVAFKLMSALVKEFLEEKEAKDYIEETLDIAALGTVADCMNLVGENRIIVEAGLKQLKKSRSKGLRKLIESKINEDLDSDIFSFLLGPKLNAAGRLDSPYKAINLILNNGNTIDATISEIESLNERRRKLTYKYFDEALENINSEDNIIFYESKEISHGIIGIIAGKITEKFYRPSIVLIEEEEKYVASCRSPDYFSIVEILEKYKDYFIAFGGHKQAAGFSITKDKFPKFKEKIIQDLNNLDFSIFKKSLYIDKVITINEIGFNFYNTISKFKPFGLGNPKPIFIIENFKYNKIEYLGKGIEHLKFDVGNGLKLCAFFMGKYIEEIKKTNNLSIIFELYLDNFNGTKKLQLNIIDMITN